jgi:Kelch motif
MFMTKQHLAALTLTLIACASVHACSNGDGSSFPNAHPAEINRQYTWAKVADSAAFPGAYNFPVFTMRGQMWAFHHEGNWYSTDGRTWTKSELPVAGLNSGYQKYVQFQDAIYALGTMEGNYTNMRLTSRIARTSDFKHWEVLAETSRLPQRVFYGAVVFDNKIWLLGGFDGQRYYNDVWNSADGVQWTRVLAGAAWSPRIVGAAAVFKNRMWIIGGGLLDGEPTDGRAGTEVWSSMDGLNWERATDRMARLWGASPIVYDGKLWLVGANRDGSFSRAVLVTDDGVNWREESALWSPRGGVATWVFDDKLYMTGGKYSVTENGEIKFIYSNDVWSMTASRK